MILNIHILILNLKKYSHYSRCRSGSKKLVTLKLKFILKLADVIIYDALVNKNILKDCKENALLIYAGKTKKFCTQSEINHLMVKYANLGKKFLD